MQSGPRMKSPWLRSRNWDLTFLIGSVVLVAVPLSLFYFAKVPTAAINIFVGAVIGGPHLYSTYTLTFMDGAFRKRHPFYLGSALLVPVIVVALAFTNLRLLLTVFFFWASVHVLHQTCYLNECYRARNPLQRTFGRRIVDYGLILTSLYPIASYKLIHNRFVVGGIVIPVPAPFKAIWVVYLVSILFGVLVLLFTVRSIIDARRGQLNVPATLLVGVTVLVAFFIPSFSNLDVAFQSFNMWHSFQYLALIWLVNQLRKKRGEVVNPVVSRFCGRGTTWYAWNLSVTAVAALLIVGLHWGLGVAFAQAYYSVVLGTLLIHYYQDHFIVTRFGAVVPDRLSEPLWFAAST